jgi:hypothetical protein
MIKYEFYFLLLLNKLLKKPFGFGGATAATAAPGAGAGAIAFPNTYLI